MSQLRTGRQKYYNIFSRFYDLFIKLHSHNYGEETRRFLVDSAQLEDKSNPRILDICCGTGSVVLAFAKQFSEILAIGYDFSLGMLQKAKKKDAVDGSKGFPGICKTGHISIRENFSPCQLITQPIR